MSEKRIDKEDWNAYTWDEISAYYKGKYKKMDIESYWESCRPTKGGAKAKAKMKGKAQAAAKPKAKAKATAKAPAGCPKKYKTGQQIYQKPSNVFCQTH